MKTQENRSIHPLAWAAGITLIVFCSVGVGAFMGWIPGSEGKPGEPSLVGKAERSSPAQPASRPAAKAPRPVAAVCAECGVVQSVNEVKVRGEASGIGAVGGGVVGGVAGHQVGDGDTRKVATVVGAVAGAVAGNAIEKHVRNSKDFQITVRFEDGSTRVITEHDATTWRAGDKIRVVNGVIQSNA
jgi:outer membrane lipoprotein SlyB